MAKIKFDSFGSYDREIDQLIRSLLDNELKNKKSDDIRDAILSDGAMAHLIAAKNTSEKMREQKRANNKLDLCLDENEYIQVLKEGVLAIQPAVEKALSLGSKSLDHSFSFFISNMEKFFQANGSLFYAIDHEASQAKYRKLIELGEKWPFRDQDINKENSKKALDSACEASHSKTIKLVDDLNLLGKTQQAEILIAKFNYAMDLCKKFMNPESKVSLIDPTNFKRSFSHTKAYKNEKEATINQISF